MVIFLFELMHFMFTWLYGSTDVTHQGDICHLSVWRSMWTEVLWSGEDLCLCSFAHLLRGHCRV